MADQSEAGEAALPNAPASGALQIAVLAALASMGTLATNILLPSLPQIAISLNVTSAAVTSAITIYLAAFALGQLLVGPLSDRYGRRWPVLTGFAVFFAGSVWCGLASDLPNLLIGRVLQASGACATSVLSRAIARDLFSGAALARAMALIMIAMSAAPGLSPLLGGALDQAFGWRSVRRESGCGFSAARLLANDERRGRRMDGRHRVAQSNLAPQAQCWRPFARCSGAVRS